MPGSTETSVSTTAARTVKPYWEYEPSAGPAKIYHFFASQAVDDFLIKNSDLSDETLALISEAVDIAVSVVLRAANVETSWETLYQQVTEPLRQSAVEQEEEDQP